MENKFFVRAIKTPKLLLKYFKNTFYRYSYKSILSIGFVIVFSQCENNEKFYRPNLPEKLCSIGIIDADDTLRYISFEKSFQAEYPEEVNDSLRGLAFKISSSNSLLVNYHCDSTIKHLSGHKIPDDVQFKSGEKYFLTASENSTPPIRAEVIVPQPPSQPRLISVTKEFVPLPEPNNCQGKTAKSAVISFSFPNNSEQKMYYALLFEGAGFHVHSLYTPYKALLDFTVRECNSPGFFAVVHGFKMYHHICYPTGQIIVSPVFAYFIEGSKISGNECTLTLSTQFNDAYSIYDYLKSIRIKVLSIPESMYLFEKALYTYKQTSDDPFMEPVYLNGNIKDGNGVFAICRSSELIVKFSPLF